MLAGLALSSGADAQSRCATDQMHESYKKQNPNVVVYEKQLNESIASFIANRSRGVDAAARTTAVHNDTDYYDIPVVVHVIHNYGPELLKDSAIYAMMTYLNKFYSAENNLTPIIQPFKKYIGKAKMRFHLATKDPLGNPTKGITHRFSYLTYGGDDQAKVDQWPPRNYYNIWFENVIGRGVVGGTVLAYAQLPADAEALPYYDGVIANYGFINDENTIPHETGHIFNLYHPWNSGAGVGEVCGDDEVDDTPPTKGHFSVCPLYDTTCAINYYKVYVSASGLADSLVDYPDTTNAQNIMDYSQCAQTMLTKGQVWRMRATLNSSMGGRNNLWDSANLVATGAMDAYPDLPPVTDFISKVTMSPISQFSFFTYPGANLYYTNKSWGDTIESVDWTFSNSATKPTVSSSGYHDLNTAFINSFGDPGWATITMAATGNNSGTTTKEYKNVIFVADNEGKNPITGTTYYQEFDEGGDRDKWPMFNYYGNNLKWQLANVGAVDNSCVMFNGYDDRTGISLLKNTPKGDFDDMYTIPFNLSGFGSGACNMNFFYSGASRTSSSESITDTLLIDYAINKSQTWINMATLAKGTLCNRGAVSTPYVPTSFADWSQMSINIPEAARKDYVVFRFRYKPGVINGGFISTGNNYYLDRLSITPWAVDVSNVNMANIDMKVVPNPTHGDAYVVINDASNANADLVVSDITGKVVYSTSATIQGRTGRIVIPSETIGVKGVYLVQVHTGAQSATQKLVVY